MVGRDSIGREGTGGIELNPLVDGGGLESREVLEYFFFGDPDSGLSIEASDSRRCRRGCSRWAPAADESEWVPSKADAASVGGTATVGDADNRVERTGRSKGFITRPSRELIEVLELATDPLPTKH